MYWKSFLEANMTMLVSELCNMLIQIQLEEEFPKSLNLTVVDIFDMKIKIPSNQKTTTGCRSLINVCSKFMEQWTQKMNFLFGVVLHNNFFLLIELIKRIYKHSMMQLV